MVQCSWGTEYFKSANLVCSMLPHISTHHLPNLHDVVLGDGADDPGFIRVPGKVRYLCCVSAVNELQKGHPIQIHDMLVAKAYSNFKYKKMDSKVRDSELITAVNWLALWILYNNIFFYPFQIKFGMHPGTSCIKQISFSLWFLRLPVL